MDKQLLKDVLGFGLALWLIGYILGMVLFFVLPQSFIGWVIMPIGIIITLWVLFKRIIAKGMNHYIILAFAWTAIAIVLDYIFIVKMLNSADYYKLDVYIYYASTFILPLAAGWLKKGRSKIAAKR